MMLASHATYPGRNAALLKKHGHDTYTGQTSSKLNETGSSHIHSLLSHPQLETLFSRISHTCWSC